MKLPIIYILAVTGAMLFAGCAWQPKPVPATPASPGAGAVITEQGDRISEALAYNGLLGTGVATSPQTPIVQYAPVVEAQRQSLDAAEAGEKAAAEAMAKRESEWAGIIKARDEHIAAGDKAYEQMRAKWYVVWGVWIERILWTLAIGWGVLGILSIILGLGNPIGWTAKLGKEIVRLLPAMNIFAWIRDGINSWRKK